MIENRTVHCIKQNTGIVVYTFSLVEGYRVQPIIVFISLADKD